MEAVRKITNRPSLWIAEFLTEMNMHSGKRISALAAGLMVVAILALPGQALAAGSSQCQAYNPQVACEPPVNISQSQAGNLPFTGIDVVLLASGGAVMIAAGVGIRLLSRRLGHDSKGH
ncbi:MAG TPA: hypothetical protein VGY32_14695 [Solirubrobacteraceae bacterium]|jgi:hypothetical protein|nr:hypothetical protein [Solirubrobacteraceae bacterium]